MGTDKNLTLALLDYAAGDVRLSGQHEKMLVVRGGDGTVEVVDTIDLGFPVALTDEITDFIQHTTVRLQPGDGVVLYTDGITEAEDLAREQYGLERLCAVVSRHWTAPAEVIKEYVVKDVHQHMGAQRMYDDITLVVVKRR
jgi:sigma-B regulation protein RsbU (phosphoserine phosphatase)